MNRYVKAFMKMICFIGSIIAYFTIPPYWFVTQCETGSVLGKDCVMNSFGEAYTVAVQVWGILGIVLGVFVVALCGLFYSFLSKEKDEVL